MRSLSSDSNATDAVTATQLRDRAAEVLTRAAFGKRRTLIKRHGKALAAVVPVEDLERLEALDDAADARAAAAVLARMAKARDRGVPWSEPRKGLVRKPGK